MMTPSGKIDARFKTTKAALEELRQAIRTLVGHEVLVGFPDETADRRDDTGTMSHGKAVLGAASEITNAALGYIHDNGAPDENIPARPFMIPGIESVADKVAQRLFMVAKAQLTTPSLDPIAGLHSVGIVAVTGIKRKINEGIPPPLSDRTLRARARKGRTGASWELAWRAAGAPEGTELAKPLIDTGQLRNAISYVVRERSR
jgi:hypothetical protein